jgi:5-methylthioadenosine/S-adenosylhomocysteine deaminase
MALTVSGASLEGERVGLRAVDGAIEALGPGVEPRPGDEVIDGTDLAIVPGFVNAHTHAAMTLFRGYADDLPLMEWLQGYIWPAERRLEREDVYWGTRLACLEMARAGTVRFWDMYWKHAETARAVKDAGLRAVVGAPLIDGDDPDGAPKLLAKARRAIDEIEEAGEGAAVAALAPHAIYTVSEPSLRGIAEISAERRVPIQIHLSETEGEVSACLQEHGMRPAHYLDSCGLLGPQTLLAHCVWLDRDEIELIVERGATLVTNPVANLKLAVGGVFPYAQARAANAQVGLGTDGAGSNNSLDMLSDVKAFALIQKHVAADPAAITAGEAWEIATGRRSALIGGTAPAQGGVADFALVRLNSPGLALGALDAGLVYAADASAVAVTVVEGRVVYRQGVRGEADEIVARARERAARLFGGSAQAGVASAASSSDASPTK